MEEKVKFILKWLGIMFILSVITFLIVRFIPVSPIDMLLQHYNLPLTEENRKLLTSYYKLDQSLFKQYIVWIKDFLNLPLKFNSKNGAAAALQEVSNELNEMVKGDPNLLEYLKDPGGTFKWRIIAGTNRLSAHSYGIAIDINVKKSHYWQWSKGYENLIPEKIVRVFEKHKFVWGGRWKHFDTMHFEYRPEMFE